MRPHGTFLTIFFVAGLFILPHAAHAAIPFFGPIVPDSIQRCAAGWGAVMMVVNNIIELLITIAIVFVAPIMIAYSGFLLVINQGDPGNLSKAKGILTNTIVGIVIALSAWMVVDAIMAALYNPNAVGATWSSLVTTGGDLCLLQEGSLQNLNQASQTGGATPGIGVACSIPSLTPLTDPLALQMEGGQTVIWANTDPRLQSCVNRFISKVGGSVTSAYRPQEYQTHLWEIRDRWCTQGLQSNSDSVCSSLKSAVSAEVAKHFGSAWSCGAVGATSRHTAGTGVDIAGIDQGSAAVQQAASDSCLTWQNYPGDPYHYDLKASCTCQ